MADDAGGNGEGMDLGGGVHIAQQGATLNAGSLRRGIDDHRLHRAEIDDQPVVLDAVPRKAVGATAYRKVQIGLASSQDRRRDILSGGAFDDHRRPPVDVRVPHPAGLVVTSDSSGVMIPPFMRARRDSIPRPAATTMT